MVLPGNLSNGLIVMGNGGSNKNGTLILGLTAENQAGFKMASWGQQPDINGVPGKRWDSRLGKVCLTLAGSSAKNSCNATAIADTGSINGLTEFKSASTAGKLKPGILRSANAVKVAIKGIFDYSLTPGTRDGFNRWSLSVSPQAEQTIFVNPGIAFFDKYDVLFDQVNGKQGFRSRR